MCQILFLTCDFVLVLLFMILSAFTNEIKSNQNHKM